MWCTKILRVYVHVCKIAAVELIAYFLDYTMYIIYACFSSVEVFK